MPDTGYPDYTRLSREGQFQLFFGSNFTPVNNTVMFQGYVGNFPFINVFANMGASADFMTMFFAWYTDSTFTTQIAFRAAVKTGNNFTVAQYANLSDWLQIFYVSKSGGNMTFTSLSVYGTQQPSGQRQLASSDVAFFSSSGSIAASTTITTTITKVIPGPSIFNLFTGATAWNVNFLYYDFGANAYVIDYVAVGTTFANSGCHIEIPLLDCPMQIQIQNQDAAARTFQCIWAPSS